MQTVYHRRAFRRIWRRTLSALLVVASCVLFGRLLIAQQAAQQAPQAPQSANQQIPVPNQASYSQPCYLGGTGPVPNSTNGSQGSTPLLGSSQTQTPTEEYDDGTGQDATLQGLQAPQTLPGRTSDRQGVSANEIVSALEQAPDLVTTFKMIAAQGFGVDPTIISDDGLYNCIRQDPDFRRQVAAELRTRGYITSDASSGLRENAVPGEVPSGSQQTSIPRRQPPPGRGTGAAEEPTPSDLRTRTPIPYSNLPSLVDLYTQDVPSAKNLRRFGSDMFRLGTGNANQLPMDLPVGPDYVLGPGDSLVLNMWGAQAARVERTIDRQGQIAVPEAGAINVNGLTIEQAQSALQRALNTQFQNEHAEISLGRVRTVRVYVVGDVQRPGAYDISSLSTPLNALFAAGGPTSRGSLRVVSQYRGKQLIREIDLYEFLLHGVRSDLDRLLPGDTILVPPVGPQVAVAGMVRRPAIYELKGEQNLDQVLNLSGGLLSTANVQEVRVTRVEAHERRTSMSVRVSDGTPGKLPQIPQFPVQDQDEVYVSPILPYNQQLVYLDGHVFKPGPYAWREGMTVADLLHSYQDVMPEPAAHAEIIRLQPPDFRPQTISFDLPDLLIGDDPITLQPFDVVRIFGRYDIDPPKVSIYGEVVRPGTYPMSSGMTVAALVRMAGGFRRSAYQDEADLASYEVQNGQKVKIGYAVVAIRKALEGDKTADVTLKPGDVVGIRQLTGWQDVGASITIEGEVKFAGSYGIDEGERLSSVLKRAGGFREDAYPAGAVLKRVQVRQLEENSRQEMIRRIETTVPRAAAGVTTTSQDQQNLLQAMRQQQQDVLTALRSHPSAGRLVVKISDDISKWENTPADIVVRAGDQLTVPKRPDFVLVTGQVFNATAITFQPGKTAGWYLHQAGGVTRSGDKRSIFVLRADGSVVSGSGASLLSGGVLDVRMHAGDSVIVPEKVIGGSQIWRNVLGTASIMSSVALTGAAAGLF